MGNKATTRRSFLGRAGAGGLALVSGSAWTGPAGAAAVWGLALSLVLEWEGERLQPEEIWLAVIVTMVGVFTTRMVAIARGWRGWRYA